MENIADGLRLSTDLLAGPVWVTLAYFLVYYLSIINILRVKSGLATEYKARGEKFDRYFGQDRKLLAADRIQLNMLEHMPIFLTLMWMHALVVDVTQATYLGGAYTALRVIYPLIIGGRMGRRTPMRILPVTFTGYTILLIFIIQIIANI